MPTVKKEITAGRSAFGKAKKAMNDKLALRHVRKVFSQCPAYVDRMQTAQWSKDSNKGNEGKR